MQKFYVYIHRRASDGSVFYVGKGNRYRAWSRHSRNKKWKACVEEHGFLVEICKSGMHEDCALTLERILISIFGMDSLVNAVLGGGGISGYKHTAEAKAKISAAGMGRPFHQNSRIGLMARRGCKLTVEHKQKLSAAKRGRPGPKKSDETRMKISASHMGIRPSQEAIEKMRAAKIGKCVGKQSPTYDHTLRQFHHADHGGFFGTRAELMEKYGLHASCMSHLLNGKRETVKGWRLK